MRQIKLEIELKSLTQVLFWLLQKDVGHMRKIKWKLN